MTRLNGKKWLLESQITRTHLSSVRYSEKIMPEGTPYSLISLDGLSKPANTLIKKVSSAIGGIFEPWQIERVAKSKAKSALIETQSEIEITDLHHRAMHRFVEEEALRQENMERIAMKALPKLNENSNPSKVENDWITNFFDKSRIVSDDEMQNLWSSILAGEANAPGSYSKRTVNFLGDLDKEDAESLQTLCSFGWIIGEFTPLVFDSEAKIYSDFGLSFSSLSHMDSIGLIQYNSLEGFARFNMPEAFTASYFNQTLSLNINKSSNKMLPIGKVLLSKIGQELATVCVPSNVDGFFEYVKEKWKGYLVE